MNGWNDGDIIHACHPAPVRHAHGGGERLAFVPVVTPVRLRHAAASEFQQLAVWENGRKRPILAHEGALWMKPDREAAHHGIRGLAGVLQHPDEDPDWHFEYRFLRTPLLAWKPSGHTRGDARQVPKPGSVVHDGTERARADLKAFLDANIRVVEGEVMVRCRGPLATHEVYHLTPYFVVHLAGPQITGPSFWNSEHVFSPRIDRVQEFWEFEKRFHAHAGSGRVSAKSAEFGVSLDRKGLNGLDESLFADDDVLDYANDAPRMVLRALAELTRAHPEIPSAGLQAMAYALLPWRALGDIGAVRMEEAEEVAQQVVAFVGALERAYGKENVPLATRKAGRYGEEIILPVIRQSQEAMPQEDAEALGAAMRP